MTQDEIYKMAREAGALQISFNTFSMQYEYSMFQKEIEAFAKLVDAKATAREREACAKVCDEYAKDSDWPTADNCADAIRARGEA